MKVISQRALLLATKRLPCILTSLTHLAPKLLLGIPHRPEFWATGLTGSDASLPIPKSFYPPVLGTQGNHRL